MITNGQARRIASEWHGGQGSFLYTFASSGSTMNVRTDAARCRRCEELVYPLDNSAELWVVDAHGSSADGLTYCPPDPDGRTPIEGDHIPEPYGLLREISDLKTTAASPEVAYELDALSRYVKHVGIRWPVAGWHLNWDVETASDETEGRGI